MDFIPNLPSQAEESVRQEYFAKKQKEYHLVNQQRKTPGHILFEFNKKTHEIKPAVITRQAIIQMDGTVKYETKTDIHQDCFYVQALNEKKCKEASEETRVSRNSLILKKER